MIDSREIFGAEIQYFRLQPQYWQTVLNQLKQTGLRTVTTYVQWATHMVGMPDAEHPAGYFDFEGKSDPQLNLMRWLDLVAASGLNLNFRCGPFCCNEMPYGGYPKWLVMGDPSMMVWDYQNRTTQGYWIGKREGSQPSYLHPGYLELSRHWLAAVDTIIRPRLKSNGGFITMINLDNEISYIVKDSFLDSDYNPVNVGPGGFYHQFLTEKYHSIANVPYRRRPGSIEQIQPPRQIPEQLGEDLPWHTDWIEFKTWCMCRYIRALRQMHEGNGVSDVCFMTNFNPHLPEGVPTRMSAFQEAVGPKGLVGYDFYRGCFMSYSGYQSMARVLKLMAASVDFVWSAEFMAGTWVRDLTKSSRVSADHMRFMARCALAQGCKAIDWFMFHDRDCWGDSPVSTHGHRRPSWNVLQEVPTLLFEKIKHWNELVPQFDVGIVYDLIQHQHTALGDPSPCNDNDLHIGRPTIDSVQAGKATNEYMGLFRLVEQNGAQAGAIDVLARPAELKKYPLVLMPGSPVLESAAEEALSDYVRGGGVLIITGPWPSRDELGQQRGFFGQTAPQARVQLGAGTIHWHSAWIAQDKPEQESLESIALVGQWMKSITPAVHIRPAEPIAPVDWIEGGGGGPHPQPRTMASAILHLCPQERVVFVLNHYITAAEFELRFADTTIKELIDLDDGRRIAVSGGIAKVDVDRKAAAVYRVL